MRGSLHFSIWFSKSECRLESVGEISLTESKVLADEPLCLGQSEQLKEIERRCLLEKKQTLAEGFVFV